MKILKRIAALGVFSAALLVTGCNDFERTTFQTLSSSRDVMNKAQADYESRTLPHNQCVYSLVTNAKVVQVAAEQAMLVYEERKATKQDLTAQTALVASTVVGIAPLVVKIKTLYTNPVAACGGAN